MKYLFLGAALLAPLAATAEDLEGIWFGGVAGGPKEWDHKAAQVAVQPEIVGEIAQVSFKFDGWKGIGIGQCLYYGRLSDTGDAELTVSDKGSGNNWKLTCPPTLNATFKRTAPETVEVTADGIVGLPATPIALNEVLRPLKPEELPTVPDNLDILDVRLGMTRSEAEKILTEKGFAQNPKWDKGMQGMTWTQAFISYFRQPDGEDSKSLDQVTLSYTSVPKDGGGEERVLGMERTSKVDLSKSLTPDVLRDALSGKYGAFDDRGGAMFYDQSGALADRNTWCGQGSMQGIPRSLSFTNGGSFSPYCGTEVGVGMSIDAQTSMVSNYSIRITSDGLAANDFWGRINPDIVTRIETFLTANEGPKAKAPDL